MTFSLEIEKQRSKLNYHLLFKLYVIVLKNQHAKKYVQQTIVFGNNRLEFAFTNQN